MRMSPDYFGRWARYRRIVSSVLGALNAGRRVTLASYTKATIYDRRHVAMFRADARGAWVQRGKRWEDFSGCAILVSAANGRQTITAARASSGD